MTAPRGTLQLTGSTETEPGQEPCTPAPLPAEQGWATVVPKELTLVFSHPTRPPGTSPRAVSWELCKPKHGAVAWFPVLPHSRALGLQGSSGSSGPCPCQFIFTPSCPPHVHVSHLSCMQAL